MASRLWTVLPSVFAGVLIGAVLMQALAPPVSGTSVPSHSFSTATGCADADDPHGWVGQVPEGDHRSVYLMNYTFTHDAPDIELQSELAEDAPGAWTLALTTTAGDSGKEVPDDCQPRTVLDVAVALPTAAESLTVTLDGDHVTVVDTTASSPHFAFLQ